MITSVTKMIVIQNNSFMISPFKSNAGDRLSIDIDRSSHVGGVASLLSPAAAYNMVGDRQPSDPTNWDNGLLANNLTPISQLDQPHRVHEPRISDHHPPVTQLETEG